MLFKRVNYLTILSLICVIGSVQTQILYNLQSYYQTTSTNVPEPIAQCRVTCLAKFLKDEGINDVTVDMPSVCSQIKECLSCWDLCRILVEENKKVARGLCRNKNCVSIHHIPII